MNKLIFLVIGILSVGTILGFSFTVLAEEGLIPSWIKTTAGFWVDDLISDTEFISALQFLVKEGILVIPSSEVETTETKELTPPPKQTTPDDTTQSCSGSARCISGTVTRVVDGDTIHVDGQSIRFALASTPELNEYGGKEARDHIEQICPVGSKVLVDEDDGQTEGSYGRIIAVIYCNGLNLNDQVIENGFGYLASGFCDRSEFSTHAWAQKHGCTNTSFSGSDISVQQSVTTQSSCDPSYPDVCIPPSPPDLDCGEIEFRNFKVLQPDPHRFDGDKDGIGCET